MRCRHIDRAAGFLGLTLCGVLLLSLRAAARRSHRRVRAGSFPTRKSATSRSPRPTRGRSLWKLYARYAATYNARNLVVARARARRLLRRARAALLDADGARGRAEPAHPQHGGARQRRAPDHRGHAALDRGAAFPESRAEDRRAGRPVRPGRARRATSSPDTDSRATPTCGTTSSSARWRRRCDPFRRAHGRSAGADR